LSVVGQTVPSLQNVIDQAIFHGITGIHEIIPFGVFPDTLQRLRRVSGQNPIELSADLQDLGGVNVDIGSLPFETTQRLVEHDPRVRQTISFPVGTPCEKYGTDTECLADA
jgi:hypothetical protein